MNASEVCKIGMWDENSVRKALKHIQDDDMARDLIKHLLHYDPSRRFASMRQALEHPFFLGGTAEVQGEAPQRSQITESFAAPNNNTLGTNQSTTNVSRPVSNPRYLGSKRGSDHPDLAQTDSTESTVENRVNGVKSSRRSSSSNSTENSRRSGFRGLMRRRQQAN